MKYVAEFSKGKGYSKSDLRESGIPVILYGRMYTKYQLRMSEVDTFVTGEKGDVLSRGNEVIVPASGETSIDIARASAVVKPGILLGGDLNILRPTEDINPTFLALILSNGKQQKKLAKMAQGKSVVHVRNSDIQKINIYCPKRHEQDRIAQLVVCIDNLITLHQCNP